MPQNNKKDASKKFVNLDELMVNDFHGPFPTSPGINISSLSLIICSKWEESKGAPHKMKQELEGRKKTSRVKDQNLHFSMLVIDWSLLINSSSKDILESLKLVGQDLTTITKVFPYETIELSQPDSPNFKVNGHRVKHYFGGDLPPDVVQDLHTFSKDN
ncbi:hypothetical protein Tco_1428929 [Tanacetum coccineum]